MIQYIFSLIKQITKFLVLILVLLGISSLFSVNAEEAKQNGERKPPEGNLIYMELPEGTVVIRTFPEIAPGHVAQITNLVDRGFYDGIVFHRVIEGFMAQTGDPTGTGMGGSGRKIRAEFSDVSHKRGIVSMARAQDRDSADSQFFIVLEDAPYLDGQYTVWGEVIEGMDVVDRIKKGEASKNGMVVEPDKIIRMHR